MNVASVDTEQTDPQQDDATSEIRQTPSLTIVKSLTNADDDLVVTAAGHVIDYTITVTNTGNQDLTTVALTDDMPTGADVTNLQAIETLTVDGTSVIADGILATDETWVYTTSYKVTQADINAGTALVNVASVDTEQTDPQQDDATSEIRQTPSLTIVKSLTNADDDLVVTAAGHVIDYTITVTNTGNQDLTTVALTDDMPTGADVTNLQAIETLTVDGTSVIADGILATDETWVYTTSYKVTQADINAGTALVNVASVDTEQTDPQQDDATSEIRQTPSLTIVKSLTNADDDLVVTAAGHVIDYTITVTNTGNQDLTTVVVTDVFAGGATLTSGDQAVGDVGHGILETTETWVYTADYTVTQADLNAGTDLVNTASVITDQTSDPVDDSATSIVSQSPDFEIKVDVDVDPIEVTWLTVEDTEEFIEVTEQSADELVYNIAIPNTGTVPLSDPVLTFVVEQNTSSGTVTIPLVTGPIYQSGDVNNDGVLDVAETWVYTATVAVTEQMVGKGRGNITGTGTFNAHSVNSSGVPLRAKKADASTQIVPNIVFAASSGSNDLDIAKATLSTTVRQGDVMPWVITVTNNASAGAEVVSVTDTLPSGFIFQQGTATVNGLPVDPLHNGSVITFPAVQVAAGARRQQLSSIP